MTRLSGLLSPRSTIAGASRALRRGASVTPWFGAALLAGATAWADPRSELIERIDALTHLAAEFTQKQHDPSGVLLEEAKGFIRLQRPKLRWEVVSPYPQVVVADQNEFKVYDPDLEQVIVRPLGEALQDTPLALLTRSTLSLSDDYEVRTLGNGAYSLRPASDSALIAEIVLSFADKTLQAIDLRNPLGHTTHIRFRRFQDVSVIQSADFGLDLPAGVEFY